MPEYFIDVPVTSVSGSQTWKTTADTKVEALSRIKRGCGTFVDEDLEVQDTGLMSASVDDMYEEME